MPEGTVPESTMPEGTMPEGTATAGSLGGAAAKAAPEARGTTRPAEALDPPIPPKRGRGRLPKHPREDVTVISRGESDALTRITDEPDPEVKHDQDAERCAARQEHSEQLRDMDGYVAKFMAFTAVAAGCLFWNGSLREIGFGCGLILGYHCDNTAALGAAGRRGHKRMKLIEQLHDTDIHVAEAEESQIKWADQNMLAMLVMLAATEMAEQMQRACERVRSKTV